MTITTQEKINVLHVDEDPDFTGITRTFLEREDDRFDIETVPSAEEGLERINDRPPDCVVSDYEMPGMDGLELLRAVRTEYSDLPFILFTGKGSEAVASDAIAAGVTDYLQKESGTEQYELLANRIRNAVRARRDAKRADRQEQLMRLTELTGDTGGFELDGESDTVLLTAGTRRMIGRPDQYEIPLEEAIELFHADDREDIQQTLTKAFETGEELHDTWRLRPDDGDERILDITITPVVENGEVTKLRGVGHDITEQHSRERNLERYRTALNELPDPVVVYDENGRYDIVNDAAAEIRDVPREELTGTKSPYLERIREENPAEYDALLEGKLDTLEVELIAEFSGHGTRTLECRLSLMTDAADADGIVIVTRDITEQKQMERALKQERDLVTGIVETVPVGLSVVDADGSISFVNERMESIGGWSFEELENMPHDDSRYDLVDEHGEPLESGETPFNQVVSRETAIHNRVVGIRRPSGERVWLSVSGAPQYDDDGELERAVFAFEDITEQRKLEAEFAEMLGRVSDAFYALDDEFRFTHVNHRAEELLGASEDELLGETVWDMYPEAAETDRIWDAFHAAMETQDPRSLELYYEPLDFWVEASVYPSESGISVYFRDVTEQKEYERELEAKNERLEEFTSLVSHDLRSPLTVAEGHLELAQDSCESPHLAQAADAIGRSQALIEDLLTLARKGEDVSETEPVELADVAESSWHAVETAHATLETHATQTLQADRSRLKQLLENLYRNAVEHGPDDVTVSVGAMDGGFYVADTGPGIPEGDREEIFEAGYSTSEEGTGFGLRIVTQVASAHGWDIRVTDSDGEGARFEVTGVEFADR